MRRPFFAPEFFQISMMDCGVGALACFLRGYGVDASYERLREACQTSVDGTSIEALEDLATDLGVDVVQHLLPNDLFLEGLEGRLPAVYVVSTEGLSLHFVTLWRVVGRWVQIMDPARGRAWVSRSDLERSLHRVSLPFSSEEWRDWFLTSAFREALAERATRLLPSRQALALTERMASTERPEEIAAADAALRVVAKAHAAAGSRDARWRLELFERTYSTALASPASLPSSFWSWEVRPDEVIVHAGVALAVDRQFWVPTGNGTSHGQSLRPESSAAQVLLRDGESRAGIWHDVFSLLSVKARVLALASIVATVVAAGAAAVELVVLRAATWDAARLFAAPGHRAAVVAIVTSLFAILACLEGLLSVSGRAIGRELELKLRALTFELLPRVDDAFVRSRPAGDLANRAYGLEIGRQFPPLVFATWRATLDLLATMAALAVIDARNIPIVLVGSLALAASAFIANAQFREVDTRFQAHGARLLNLFLDALRGFRPVRLHGYQALLRTEQNRELVLWRDTGLKQARLQGLLEAWQALLVTLWIGAIFWNQVASSNDPRVFVLVAFWALRLPGSIQLLISAGQSYAPMRNAFVRLLEITRYAAPAAHAPSDEEPASQSPGVSLEIRDARIVAGGQTLLKIDSLYIPPGQHVAIVGPSGAGKSTLASLALGFHHLAEGTAAVDGHPLTRARMDVLRQSIAWVDPAAQIWNTSFLENLEYAAAGSVRRDMLATLEASDLLGVLDGMDRGLDTAVGADGRLLSGGEGQRLRLGRALLRKDIRLAVFDEAFRGLERDTRKRLALHARIALQRATMLFVSHDISHALDFERVLVIDGGRIVEDGHPLVLSGVDSRFRDLIEAERNMLGETWAPRFWRRLRVARGVVTEAGGA